MIEKDRIIFRPEPGRQPTADAQFLRKQLLKFVSREIARRQKLNLPLGTDTYDPIEGSDRLDILEVDLQMWRLHEDWDPRNPKHSLKAEAPDFLEIAAELAKWKEERRQARLARRAQKRGSRGNRTPA